jgi:hypothetical protein
MNSVDTLWSDPICVFFNEPPVIDTLSEEVCTGSGINLKINTSFHSNAVYEWNSDKSGILPSTADTCYLNSVVENDTIRITAATFCGDTASGLISLVVFPLPEIGLGKDTTLIAGDSISLDAGPGYAGYWWSTGEQNQQIYSFGNDTVWVKVTDWHSCMGSDTIIISANPLTDKASLTEDLKWMIYPNPAKNKLYLKLTGNDIHPGRITVIAQDGKLMSEQEIWNSGEYEIDLSAFGKGIYILRIESDAAIRTGKFVVQ